MSELRRTASGSVDGRSTRSQRDVGLTEMLRQRILDEIVRGDIAQGEVIQTAQLAKKYQTSRTPVREALGSLQRAGLIEVLPYRGYIIRPVTLPEARDIFFMRKVIEGAAAERAAIRFDAKEAEDLWPSDQSYEAYTLTFDSACHEFHRKIAGVANSPRLTDAVERIFHDVQRLRAIVAAPPAPEAINDEHIAIRDALAAHDAPAARSAMEDHIRSLYWQAVGTLSE